MPDPQKPVGDDEPKYRIGAACRLTGLSQHVLRVWEKRYGVVDPERSESQRRLYRESDIRRLSLLKALVDRGQAIGSIADLDTAELEQRLQQSTATMQLLQPADKPVLALFGETLVATREACETSEIFEFTGHFDQVSDSGSQSKARLNARLLILVYDYASRSALRRLQSDRVTALSSPLDIAALEAVVAWRFGFKPAREESPETTGGVIPSRQFNDRELAHLAAQSPAIACECPMHLAQLITSLVRFEIYSAECENRNAEDAALHSYLHNTTSRARSMMERALARVVELENLSTLPDS
jgi:DNA-binding transcriptional MerR regulator